MYRIPAWKHGFADDGIPTSALPTPEDDAMDQHRDVEVGQPIPTILSRHRQGFGGSSVPRSYPGVSPENYSLHLRDSPSAPYSEASCHIHPPSGAQHARPSSCFYTWRPKETTGGVNQNVNAQQDAVDRQTKSNRKLPTALGNTLGSNAALRGKGQIIPQKRRLDDDYHYEPQGYAEQPVFQMQGQRRLHAQPTTIAVPLLSVAPQHEVDHRGLPQLPPTEAKLLEAIQDHYRETGDRLNYKVTSQLSSHHGQLRQRLQKIASVDEKFLRRLDTCNVLLSRPFSETVTFRSDGSDAGVKLGDEVARMKQKTAELADFFERKAKEWDDAKAAEDEAWERILHVLRSQDSRGDMGSQVKAFLSKVEEEEKLAFEVMDLNKQAFDEEANKVKQENGDDLFRF